MNQDGCSQMPVTVIQKTNDNAKQKGIDSLDQIHMVKPKQDGADNGCRPEAGILFHPAEYESPEYKFFHNRGHNDRTDHD